MWSPGPGLAVFLTAGVMLAGWAIGRAAGRRARARGVASAHFHEASVTLLGIMLAFTFGISLQKYSARREAVVRDANAIGEFATCASLLPDPSRSLLRATVREYAGVRLGMARNTSPETFEAGLVKCDLLQARMKELVREMLRQGTPVATPLTNTLNALMSAHGARLAAVRDRLPLEIFGVLLIAAGLALTLVGRSQGIAGDHTEPGTFAFILVASMLVWVISDLNDSRRGFIRVTQEPLERVFASLSEAGDSP